MKLKTLKIEEGLYLKYNEGHPHYKRCFVCYNETFYSFSCPDPKDHAYWSRFFGLLFKILDSEKRIIYPRVIVCSKKCWKGLIKPYKARLVVQLCKDK